MARYFSRGLPTLACDQARCTTRVEFPARITLPTRQDRETPEQRKQRQELSMQAFRDLAMQPLPERWLKLDGGDYYLQIERPDNSPNDPEFCSVNCARLWLMARLTNAKKREKNG